MQNHIIEIEITNKKIEEYISKIEIIHITDKKP